MNIRIWSRKVFSVLEYFHRHPHLVLFGITGDLDNLGVYVARNGRAKAEVLVDIYNRVIGSVYYTFIQSKPHKFFETCFLPSGEEIFILGVAGDKEAAQSLFDHLRLAHIPEIITDDTHLDVGKTDISFGSSVLDLKLLKPIIQNFLEAVERGDNEVSNALYTEILGVIRAELSLELDAQKFASLGISKEDVVVFRNLVYLKTLEYKENTRSLLLQVSAAFKKSSQVREHLRDLLGKGYGVGYLDSDYELRRITDISK